MEDQGIFKTSVFGGFDKQSVLNYLDDMIKKAQEREQELLSRCEEAEKERDLYLKKYSEESKKSAGLEEKEKALKEAQASLSEKEKELEELRAQAQGADAKMEEMRGQLADYEEKSRKYDEVASQVGVVMVEAQNQADIIVARAHAQAEQVAKESIENIYHINKRLDQAMEDIYGLRSYAGQAMRAFDEQMAQLDIFIKESAGRLYISAGSTELDEPARYHQPYAAQQEGYVQQPSYEAAYAMQGEESYYAPEVQPEKIPLREEGAFAEGMPAGAGKEASDFFTQPAGV